MNKKRIFITGSSGFIARNIIEKLQNKYIFVAPARKELDLTDVDSAGNFFKKNGYFDFVIHTAIVGGNRKTPNNSDIAITNLRMFFNVVKNKKHFERMIHLGSGIDYGKERPLKKVSEQEFDEYIPQDYYGFYKYLCAKYIESTDNVVNLRIFGIFGKYEDPSIRFISNALCKYILKMSITINRNVYFDYIYIDDFIKILDHFLNHKTKYRSYNIGTGKPVDLLTIAKKINNLSDYKSEIEVSQKGLANEYTCNIDRLKQEIGDFKFSNLEDSITKLYEWYLSKISSLKKKDFKNDYF